MSLCNPATHLQEHMKLKIIRDRRGDMKGRGDWKGKWRKRREKMGEEKRKRGGKTRVSSSPATNLQGHMKLI